jgi:hemin uptake protein HemP
MTASEESVSEGQSPESEGKHLPAYQSRDLFQGGKVVLIMHQGREYWLRITSAGKLILTA